MSKFPRIKGLIAAPFTPMTDGGAVNLAAIRQYADSLARQGVVGAFICGTTGEGMSMTIAERKAVAEEWVKASEGGLKIIVHVGHNCGADAAELAAHAASIGAYAIASIAPNFYKPCCAEDLVSFFEPIAAAAPGLPFYYYNMPSMSGVSIPTPKFLAAAEERIPNLQGIKFTHNDFMEMNEALSYGGGKYEILHGYDEMLLCGLALGAEGAVGSTYNYAARIYHELMDAFSRGDMDKAREMQRYSVDIVKVIVKYGGGILGGKAIMNILGIPCGECRMPLHRFTPAEYESLRHDLEAIDFFDRCKV